MTMQQPTFNLSSIAPAFEWGATAEHITLERLMGIITNQSDVLYKGWIDDQDDLVAHLDAVGVTPLSDGTFFTEQTRLGLQLRAIELGRAGRLPAIQPGAGSGGVDTLPRGLLPGTPIAFHDLQVGDIIDTYDPRKGKASRFHRRMGQLVISKAGRCDVFTDYDMICKNLSLWIQLRSRTLSKYERDDTSTAAPAVQPHLRWKVHHQATC